MNFISMFMSYYYSISCTFRYLSFGPFIFISGIHEVFTLITRPAFVMTRFIDQAHLFTELKCDFNSVAELFVRWNALDLIIDDFNYRIFDIPWRFELL